MSNTMIKEISGLTYKDWIRNIFDEEYRAIIERRRLRIKIWNDTIMILRMKGEKNGI